MPRFQSLSEVIGKSLDKYSRVNAHGMGNPLSLMDGQFIYNTADYETTGVLRWGFSVWGIDPVIGADFSTDEIT